MAGLDYGIIGLYLGLIIWLGASFANRQTSASEYFLISRSVPWWAVCFTVVATETSTLTFIGIPAQTYAARGNLTFLQLALGYVAGRFIVSAIFIPKYFARELLTSYEVLHERFGAPVRNLGSAMFLVTRSAADGIRLFATSALVATLVGIPVWGAILLLGIAMIVYTFYGGASAVIWTDVIQMFVYLAGAVIVFWFALAGVPGGMGEVLDFGAATGRFTMFNFALDFFTPNTFWAGMVGGVALTLATHGTDQFLVQRLLTARSQQQAQTGLMLSGVLVFLQFGLFLFIGVTLAAFYQHAAPPVLTRGDMLIPTFVRDYVPAGFAGFVVAAIVAAALSPSINSLAATTVNDFYLKYWKPKASDAEILRVAHRATVGWGVVQIAIALLATRLNQSVLDAGLAVLGLGAGPVLGAFLVAAMKRRVQAWPVASAMLIAWLTVWSVWKFTAVAWPWYAAIGAAVTVLLSLASSLARRPVAAALVIAAMGAAGCGKDKPAENALTGAIAVSAVPARLNGLRRTVTARGTVNPMPDGDLIVHATETSTVAELPVAEGAKVKTGDVLVRFEVPSRVAAIQAAELEGAQAVLRVEAARGRVAQLTGLVEKGLTPRMDLDNAKSELANAESEVALHRATLASAKNGEERSTIRATFPGVVLKRWHNRGDMVSGTGTDPVIRVIDPTRVQVTVDVPLQDLGQVLPGQPATISPIGAASLPATVARAASAATPDAVTAEVTLVFAQGSSAPAAGTAVVAEILVAEVSQALVVPTGAILRGDGASHVLVAGPDNRVLRRDVRVGLITPDQTQITQGLSVGEFVITSALTELKEGDLVSFSRGS
ncbi:MAG TPA: efflux RND transporter periplasmic adaptor subunit [Vicinamibacterales bacterium]|nr:efflux RND transporter periplasmic adaptor subunit [Vicinamibacterales bacterium]